LLTWVEIGTVAVVGLGAAALVEPLPPIDWGQALGMPYYLAFLPQQVAQYLQIRVQPYTTPTRVSLIFSLEPVFAAIGILVLGRAVAQWRSVGACLMLFGVLVSELGHRSEPQEQSMAVDETA
jgi:drug/metabolite transporter (DMT)-like permease